MVDGARGSSRKLARLTAVSRALTYEMALDDALDLTVQTATELLDTPRALIMLTDDEGRLRIRACRGLDEDMVARFHERLDEQLAERLTEALGPSRDCFLGVPLVVHGGVMGLMAVLRTEDRLPDDEDEWLLSALADQVSPALEVARREERREEMQDRLRDLERTANNKENALRMLDHDLRSPLSALRGYVEMLLEGIYGPLSETQTRTISRIQSISRHVGSLLHNIHAMSELTSGSVEVAVAPILLTPVVEEALDVVRLAADERGITLRTAIDSTLTVMGDGDRVRQVLIHLLENAVKYSPSQSDVAVVASVADGTAEIRVIDQGPGIPDGESERIFEPYQRLPLTAAAVQGAGLGLYLGRSLVALMGGSLTLDGDAESGATFILRLKLG